MTAEPTRQLPLPFAHQRRYAPEDFLHGLTSEAALTWLAHADRWPDRRLAIWGEAGSGKTHLLHVWAGQAGAALLHGAALAWPMHLPGSGPLVIDDAPAAAPVALLHVMNAVAQVLRPLVLAGRGHPAGWAATPPDLVSRLRALQAVELRAPEDSLMGPVLARLLAERQLSVPPPVQAWLLTRLPRSPAALAEAADRLDRAMLASGGRLSRTTAARIVDETAALWQGET